MKKIILIVALLAVVLSGCAYKVREVEKRTGWLRCRSFTGSRIGATAGSLVIVRCQCFRRFTSLRLMISRVMRRAGGW